MSSQNDINRWKIYLAALLHDIGKFYQRADDKLPNGKYRFLKQEIRDLESVYCPYSRYIGRHTHQHVLWTAQFIREYNLESKLGLKGLERLAAIHHFPAKDQPLELIIQKADHWASGADRTLSYGELDAADEANRKDFKKTQLHPVFESLFHEQDFQTGFKFRHFIPVSSLKMDKSLFPVTVADQHDYPLLWDSFAKQISSVTNKPNLSVSEFAGTLYSLLSLYTIAIPSSTQHLPDVSLFDHSKMVAAFSVCLHDYFTERPQAGEFKLNATESPVLLIGGDISGIQSYIYSIISKQAAKNLKGRSFYLSLMVDSVIQVLLNELGLFQANVVYTSGGSFYLVAPNTQRIREAIKMIESRISDNLFKAHNTALYLALNYVSLSESEVLGAPVPGKGYEREPNQIGKKWAELVEKLNAQKRTRYSNKLISDFSFFFLETEKGGLLKRDHITNEEILPDELAVSLDSDDAGAGILVKKATESQIKLGSALRNTQYIMRSDEKITYWGPKDFLHHEEPAGLGIHWYFFETIPQSVPESATIFSLNNPEILQSPLSAKGIVRDFLFYGGNQFPVDSDGYPLLFDRLAGDEEDSLRRLAILRMDVDNLGQAFISGFNDHRRTFSRYSALSRSLDFLFKGFINTIREENPLFKKYISIIYSGGDDLFIVGRWDLVLDFAEEFNRNFRKFVAGNPSLTLSAGVAVLPAKFPIFKGAQMAGDEEHKAKNHLTPLETGIIQRKNSISFLGFPMNWDSEFLLVREIKNELIDLLRSDFLPSGFLHKIRHFNNLWENQTKENKNPFWQWLMAYDFSRIKSRTKNKAIVQRLEVLENAILSNTWKGKKQPTQYHLIQLFNMASRWAELELKTTKNKRNESE